MQSRLPTEERQAEIVAAALRLARESSPALITTSDIAAAVGRHPGRGVQALSPPRTRSGWRRWAGCASSCCQSLEDRGGKARPRRWKRWAPCSRPTSSFVVAHPGVPRLIFHELQQPADSPVKQEVRALLQGYRKLLLDRLDAAVDRRRGARAELDLEAAATLFVGIVQGLVMQSMLTGNAGRDEGAGRCASSPSTGAASVRLS